MPAGEVKNAVHAYSEYSYLDQIYFDRKANAKFHCPSAELLRFLSKFSVFPTYVEKSMGS
jgi:hypothetical protein